MSSSIAFSVWSGGVDFSIQNFRFSPSSSMMFSGGVSSVHRLCIFKFLIFGMLLFVYR